MRKLQRRQEKMQHRAASAAAVGGRAGSDGASTAVPEAPAASQALGLPDHDRATVKSEWLLAASGADRPIQTIEGSTETQLGSSGLGLGSTGASYMAYGDGGLMGSDLGAQSSLGGSLYAPAAARPRPSAFRVAGTGTHPEVIGSIPATTAAAGSSTGLFDMGFGSDAIGAPGLGSGYDLPAGLPTSTSSGSGAYGTSALTGGLISSAA